MSAICLGGGAPYAFIDWQLMQSGPPGIEMVQYICGSLKDLGDYDRIDEILEDYYEKMIEATPAAKRKRIRDEYPLFMVAEDFAMTYALQMIGIIAQLGGLITALKGMPEHPIWPLIAQMMPRSMKCAEAMRVGDILEAVASRNSEKVRDLLHPENQDLGMHSAQF